MVLDFEYGINTGNRFLDLVDHDEDPEDFIATQTQPGEKPKKSSKDAKAVTSAANKKTTTTTTTTAASTTNASSNTTRTNKENLTGKSTNTDQRRQQTNVLSDNNNQQTRIDSGRGGGRGFSRRGGSAGQDRPSYEGGNRGGGQDRSSYEGGNRGGGQNRQPYEGGNRGDGQDRPPYEGGNRGRGQPRSQRFNKFGEQQSTNETSGFEQGGDAWGNEAGNDDQTFSGYRGRGRGRGGPRRGNYEGGRGDGRGRGRGRGGRGNYGNRSFEEGSQQQQQQPQQQPTQESNEWQQSTETNFDNTRSQSARTGGQELDADASTQEQSVEPDNNRRGGRGGFRSRTFHNNRNYGGDRQNQYEREGGQDDYRHNRRQYDRHPRTNVSGVKPIEKKDGEGAHNWGNPTENPDEIPVSDEITETTGQAASAPKDWAQQVDEAEKQMTLDEYRKQLEAKKRAQQEKLPQFNRRVAGEGEDPKTWQTFEQEYRKKNEGGEFEDEEEEEGSGSEVNESGEENEEEQITGKKKIITIPLHFKPIDIPRGGPGGSRGGPRRGGGGRFRDRPSRDDQQRPKSPSQQQQPPMYQQTGEYQNDEQPQQQQQQQSRPYRGGSRPGPGRNEYRRPYGNSARGSRGGYNRSNVDSNTPDLDNTVDFPTLPKQ